MSEIKQLSRKQYEGIAKKDAFLWVSKRVKGQKTALMHMQGHGFNEVYLPSAILTG